MTAEEHGAAAQPIPEELIAVLQQQVGQTVVIRYRHWVGEGFAVSSTTFEVLEVDTFWPSAVVLLKPGVATKIPLSYILSISTPEGVELFQAAS